MQHTELPADGSDQEGCAVEPDLSRYQRQIILPQFGTAGQRRLLSSRVAIAGMGALGCVSASLLARAGVGHLRLIDRDFVDLNNLQRQLLYEERDVHGAMPKALAARDALARANSGIEIEGLVADLAPGNAVNLLSGAEVIVDGIDNFEGRFLINDTAIQLGTPWIYGAVIATYGLTMDILPGQTACLQCLLPQMPAPGSVDTCDTAGIAGPIVAIIAALQATECLKLLLGRDDLQLGLRQVEAWDGEISVRPVARKADCPACIQHELRHLNAESQSRTLSLCGRDAVQVTVRDHEGFSLEALATRLRAGGEVKLTPFLLRASVEGYELSVFPDGRAIIKGTTDPAAARALYSKYVGM